MSLAASTILDADTTAPRVINISVSLIGIVDITEQIIFSDVASHPNTIIANRESRVKISLVALASPTVADYLTILNDIHYSNDDQEPTPVSGQWSSGLLTRASPVCLLLISM